MASPAFRELFFELQRDLDRINKRVSDRGFKNVKVTAIIRTPDLTDGDFVLTDDDLDAVIAAINRLKDRKPDIEPKPVS